MGFHGTFNVAGIGHVAWETNGIPSFLDYGAARLRTLCHKGAGCEC